MRLVTASLIGLLFATSLPAQEPVQETPEHEVRAGETLSEIAERYFNDARQWRAIYEANRSVVQDPDRLSPGMVLTIPRGAGERRAAADPRDPVPLGVPVSDGGERTTVVRPVVDDGPPRTVFYRPPPPDSRPTDPATILAEPVELAVPVRPGEFRSAAYLTNPAGLPVQATFLRPIRDDRPSRGAPSSAHPRDQVYLRQGAGQAVAAGDRLMVVAVGRAVTGAALADRLIHPSAVVRVVARTGDMIEAQIVNQYGPVHPGQLVIPMEAPPEFEVEAAEPVAGGADLEGAILDFVDHQPLYGPSALALINLGRAHGVTEGDVFEAYLPARVVEVKDPETGRTRTESVPAEVVAELRVVRATDSYATLRVDHVFLARLEPELPVRRIRSIP